MEARREQRRHFDKDDVLAGLGDMADWIGDRYGVPVGKPSGRTTFVQCPQHRGSMTSAHVTRWEDGPSTFKCYPCDLGPLNAIDLTIALGGAGNFSEAIKILGEQTGALTSAGFAVRKRQSSRPEPKPVGVLDDTAERVHGDEADTARAEYLLHRGWSASTWDYAGLEVIKVSGRLWIRHPYRDQIGRLRWWQDRSCQRLETGQPKWNSPPGARAWLYNGATLATDCAHFTSWDEPWNRFVHITEGPADALALLDTMALTYPAIGVPGAGTWQHEWSKALSGLVVIVSGDNDDAGRGFVDKVSHALHGFAAHTAVIMPPERYGDLAEWTKAVGEEAAFDQLMPAVEWIVTERSE